MAKTLDFLRQHFPYIVAAVLVAVNALIDSGNLSLAPHLVALINAVLVAVGLGVLHNRQQS